MDELDLARELADIAADIAMRHFSRDPEVTTKADGTLVTIADREIEAALRRRIAERFPEHGVLGEEEGLQGEASGPIWVIDPIDGTNNFAWGIPVFGTLIGLRVGGRTEVGIVSAPALGERYEAARGDGARMNGVPICVSEVGTIEQARVCFASWSEWVRAGLVERWVSILGRCRRSRGFGDFWGHMLVARGASDVMAEPELKLWDVAALEVIIEEAGGRVTDFAGRPFGGATFLTTNGRLHQELVAALSGSSPSTASY
ncbi:MAG: inositol monophosphatase family protein [Actinomycetota bacterium]